MQRAILTLAFLSVSLLSWAQTGTIRGNVKDGVSGDGVVGANVYIEGTTQGSVADINGDFEITRVKSGAYTLIISFVSYKTDTLKNITVYPDEATVINTALVEESQQLSEVVVSGQKVSNTDISVVRDIKASQMVVVGISAQQISLSQDRDAAQVVRRIPGVTILNNRFVNVRGLSERYSTVLLNGVIAPSTEVDSKAFAFDLIPSSMIDRMMVYKSGSAALSGEFAGAVINIETKSVVEDNSLSVNFTGGYRIGTSFKDFSTYKGSSTDWLGFDNGFRQLPASFPSQNLGSIFGQDVAAYTDISRSLPNNWSTQNKTASPDLRTTINFSRAGSIGNKRLSNVSSFTYANTRQHLSQENYYYDAFVPAEDKSTRRYHYHDERYATNVRLGLISNFILELNPNNKIEFRNLFNQQGQSQTTFRSGTDDANFRDVRDLALNYKSRRIYSGQLSGKHGLSDRHNFSWVVAYSNINADQPDYRNISSRKPFSDTEYAIIIPPGSSIQDGGRFFSTLKESVYTQASNLEIKLNPDANEKDQTKLSFGYYVAYTQRSFDARWFAYGWNPFSSRPSDVLVGASFTDIYKSENIGFSPENNSPLPPYFILNEGTSASDNYDGKNLLTAGYGNISFPFADKFRLNAGARVEYNKQELIALESNGVTPANVNNPVTSILPFINLTYNLSDQTLFRLAYSKTINRPVFRELATFNYYDFDRKANVFGNPDLKTANIHNIDLRWETYPSDGQSISIGAFYKLFNDPIEQLLYQGSNIIYSFDNAKSATSYGAEVEVRRSLKDMTASNFLGKFSVLLNAAWIHSEVQYDASVTTQERNRAMQGQSPYIINAGVFFNDYDKGLQINASYNVFGKRIFAVGDLDQNATQYEMPRHQIDLTVSKSFGTHFELKFGVQDILNQSYRIIQDSDRNKKINSIDEPIQNYKPGQYITLGVTYKIF